MTFNHNHPRATRSVQDFFHVLTGLSIRQALLPPLVAAAVLFASPGAAYAASMWASAGPGIADNIGPCLYTSSSLTPDFLPQSATASCVNSYGSGFAAATASWGHVGAFAVAETFSGFTFISSIGSAASYSSSGFTFSRTDGGADGEWIDAQLNLNITGSGNANEAGGWIAKIYATVNGTYVLSGSTSSAGDNFAAGNIIGNQAITSQYLVQTGVPYTVTLLIDVSVGSIGTVSGGPGHADANFANSLDFPVGADVFNLPDGYTVNAPDSYIFNNRFLPPNAVPIPPAFALFGSGLGALGLLGWCRKRRATGAVGTHA